MKLLRYLVALAAALGAQTVLTRFAPHLERYVDFTLLPVVWYGIAGSQRSAMLVGCSAGLVQDAWFRVGVFGIGGFKRTLIGWGLGGIGSRFDLNHTFGRFAAALVVALLDGLLDLGLRRLLDQAQTSALPELLARAFCTAILTLPAFAVVDRLRGRNREPGRFR